ncbi:hypothetical protein K505DRAFT_360813 [Melanomma pulvis-pyrius CBS 109.77]|uniref:BTB domain-containing protein n=1 Tax=Melanomma pulvis-pyrius CBS 109.77 TaxID=1314802 RepID=A0A6A6XFB7_9PLEO|nr:hypothetical protein K505DRAFT_360813 [Melanomma pulvis-pyrius CBS 109.77]
MSVAQVTTPIRPSTAATGGTIIVKVGPMAKEYILYKSLLSHYSGFFRGALSGKFRETSDGFITLVDIKTADFDIFVDWLYLQRLDKRFLHTVRRYHVYALADRLLAPDLKNSLFDLIFEKVEADYPSYMMIIFAFENLPEDDVLLQLLVDAQCINRGIERKMGDIDKLYFPDLPKEFLLRVMQKLNEIANKDKEDGRDNGKKRLRRDDYVVHISDIKEDMDEVESNTDSGIADSWNPDSCW